jgi:hypothetical protein
MKCSGSHLFTPLYLKLDDAMPWPDTEKAFYLLSRDGLFLCRNTRFFRSCVPVERFPSELAGHKPFLELSYPRVPRRLIELAVGFFDVIGERYNSEAAVLLVWNSLTDSVELVVPDQVGLVSTTWSGLTYPLELEYEVPPLPPHLALLGDIHSHVDGPAYASYTDMHDEAHRPGLHLVVGRILDEPPQFHCEAIADGLRFRVSDLSLVLEGYHRRRVAEVPPEWLAKITVKPWSAKPRRDTAASSGSYQSGRLLPARAETLQARALAPPEPSGGEDTGTPAQAAAPQTGFPDPPPFAAAEARPEP